MAPSNVHPFPNLKKGMSGKHYTNDDDQEDAFCTGSPGIPASLVVFLWTAEGISWDIINNQLHQRSHSWLGSEPFGHRLYLKGTFAREIGSDCNFYLNDFNITLIDFIQLVINMTQAINETLITLRQCFSFT